MKLFYIVRGLPGSGKSTLAKQLTSYVFEADQYFERTGEYNFIPSEIGKAHQWCKQQVENAMKVENAIKSNFPEIAVSNTFTQKWEVKPYIELARKYEYEVQIITVQSEFKNIHNVPEESIQRMKKRWENFSLEDFNSEI